MSINEDEDKLLSYKTNNINDISYDKDDSSDLGTKNTKSEDIHITKLNKMIGNDFPPFQKTKRRDRQKTMLISGPLLNLEEKEDILKVISKKQRKTSDYSEEDSLSFNTRESILGWCNNVLNSIKLTDIEKNSKFHSSVQHMILLWKNYF